MLQLRKANERGHARYEWLDSYHTFSFANYYDPQQMGWGPLRVINDDTVAGGGGFPTHSHNNMEIISYVLEGALEHKDTLGTGSIIRPGDVQLMQAGTGIAHSEFNHSAHESVHFLQIWIIPSRPGPPGYQQRYFGVEEKRGKFRLIVSPDGRNDSLQIRQDALLYSGYLNGGDVLEHRLDPSRLAYIHIARGTLNVNELSLEAGDGVKVDAESLLRFEKGNGAEILLFDLPA